MTFNFTIKYSLKKVKKMIFNFFEKWRDWSKNMSFENEKLLLFCF